MDGDARLAEGGEVTDAHRRYLTTEAAVSAGVNAALSVVFVLLAFGGMAAVGVPALVADAVPQSFMITLMASLVPALLTRKRLARGAIAPLRGRPRSGGVVMVSLLSAAVVAALAWGLHLALLPLLSPAAVPFGAVLAGKAVYGALLGAGVSLIAVRRALAG